MKERSPILRAHDGDEDAVRAEIAATRFEDLVAKYDVTESAVRVWESKLGVKAMRECRDCKAVVPGADMAYTADGRMNVWCAACGATKPPPKPRARAGAGGPVAHEQSKMDDSVLRSPMHRWSDQQGNWNRYAEALWESMSENQEPRSESVSASAERTCT